MDNRKVDVKKGRAVLSMYYLQESQGIGPLEQFPNAKFAYHFSYQKVAMVIKEWKLFIQDGLRGDPSPSLRKILLPPYHSSPING